VRAAEVGVPFGPVRTAAGLHVVEGMHVTPGHSGVKHLEHAGQRGQLVMPGNGGTVLWVPVKLEGTEDR